MSDFLEKYKPTADVSMIFSIDESQDDNELAFDLNKKLKTARTLQDVTFLAIGKILKIIRDRKLYKTLDYEDFQQFLNSDDLSFSREKAYVYIRIYELFVERLHMSQEDLSSMGVVRLMLLAPIVKGIESDEKALAKIEELKELRYNDFVRSVKVETNKDGRPIVYFSEELGKWLVKYYEDYTQLVSIGKYSEREIKDNE